MIAPDVVELSSAPTMKRPSTMIAQAPAVLDSKGALRGYPRPTGLAPGRLANVFNLRLWQSCRKCCGSGVALGGC